MFKRRLGQMAGKQCAYGHNCSQILEMTNGDFAAVGVDITEEAIRAMLPGPGVGPSERVVQIPRRIMIAAKLDIPSAA